MGNYEIAFEVFIKNENNYPNNIIVSRLNELTVYIKAEDSFVDLKMTNNEVFHITEYFWKDILDIISKDYSEGRIQRNVEDYLRKHFKQM